MLRDVAVQRIAEGLGFIGTRLNTTIITRMQEAQRELEAGKTLPRFLLQEDETLSLVSGTSSVALPVGFLRIAGNEDEPIRYTPSGTTIPTTIPLRNSLSAALEAFNGSAPSGPSVAVIRKASIYFLPVADQNYTITWSYYKAAAILSTNIENEWLANTRGGSEWLIGETGSRIAADTGNPRKAIFDDMALHARASLFGTIVDSEMAEGPMYIGSDN